MSRLKTILQYVKITAGKRTIHTKRPMMSSTVEDHYLPRQDSLEYFIKFPPPSSALTNRAYAPNGYSDCDFNFATDEVNTPIVLLLGWVGCQDRYLMKYSKIYEDRGLITVRYTAPVENILWKRDAMKPIGQKIVKLLYDMNFDANPIILHVFSNGGAYLYQHIDLAIKEFQTPLDICGIIFDSSPGDRRLISLYRAISSIYGKDRRCGCIISWFITLGVAAKWVVEDIYLRMKALFSPKPKATVNPYNDLKYLDNHIPQLFLYSNVDTLIPPADVETFAQFRKSIGVPVETVLFHEAEHVKLYIKYPQRYIQCVCTFISNCLLSAPMHMDSEKKFA